MSSHKGIEITIEVGTSKDLRYPQFVGPYSNEVLVFVSKDVETAYWTIDEDAPEVYEDFVKAFIAAMVIDRAPRIRLMKEI